MLVYFVKESYFWWLRISFEQTRTKYVYYSMARKYRRKAENTFTEEIKEKLRLAIRDADLLVVSGKTLVTAKQMGMLLMGSGYPTNVKKVKRVVLQEDVPRVYLGNTLYFDAMGFLDALSRRSYIRGHLRNILLGNHQCQRRAHR